MTRSRIAAFGRPLLWWLLLPLLVLVAIRTYLPTLVEDQLNRRLDSMGDYRGHIDDVDLKIWRGAYTLHSVVVQKKSGKTVAPLLDAPEIELSVSWRHLFKGSVVATAVFETPSVNFIDDAHAAGSQAGKGVDWREKLESLIPVRLDEVVIHQGTVAFRNPSARPKVDLEITEVEASIRNLTNVEGEAGSRVAKLDATGRIFGQAKFDANSAFDPFGRPDSFEFAVRAIDIDLTEASAFTSAYSGLDIASGRGDFVMEVKAEKGQIRGYAKPLLRNLKVLSLEREVKGGNPLKLLWQTAAAFAVEVFTNRKTDQFGTRVEISGSLDDKNVSVLSAVAGIVRNAFVEAYKPDYESLKKSAEPAK